VLPGSRADAPGPEQEAGRRRRGRNPGVGQQPGSIAQWAILGRQLSEFALYVPANSVEVTKRLCVENQIGVTEIWTYYEVGDQLRFAQVFRSPVELKIAAARAAASSAAAEKREAERVELAAKRAAARKKSLKKAARSGAKKAAKPAKSAKKAASARNDKRQPASGFIRPNP